MGNSHYLRSLRYNCCLEFMSYIYWLNAISTASGSNKFSEFFSHGAFFFHPLTTNTDIFIQEIVLFKDITYYYLLLSATESWWYEKCLVGFRRKPWGFRRKPWGRAVTESMKKPTFLELKHRSIRLFLNINWLRKRQYATLKKESERKRVMIKRNCFADL